MKAVILVAVGGALALFIALVLSPRLSSVGNTAIAAPSGAPPSSSPSDLAPPVVSPNYSRHEGDVYFYSVGNSASDLNGGQAVKEIVGFKYLGSPYRDGLNYVMQVDGRGLSMGMFNCANPCSIIKESNGRMVDYNPSSVIGSVFQDLANGYLGRPLYRKSEISDQPYARPHAVGPSSIYHQDTAATER